MKRNFTTVRLFWVFALLLNFVSESFGQTSYLTTVPPYSGGNSSAITTFNVKAYRKIRIKELYNSFTSAASQTVTVWYKTDSLNGAPAISTASGWIQAGVTTFTPSPTGAGNICLIPLTGLSITIPSGSTYALAITTTGSITYTGTSSTASVSPWLFNDQNMHINMGAAVGYGGTIASPIQYRQFNGKIGYEIVPIGPNNASTVAITEPSNFCPGTYNVKARIRNNGVNQITSVNVKWTLDNVSQTPISFVSLIDTFGGVFPSDTVLTLGSVTFGSVLKRNIKVWTELPNGVTDTVNADDTASASMGAAMAGVFQIGGTTPDYPSLKAFADDVTSRGLCGPVTAIVNPGTYTGKAIFNSPGGASATNNITIIGTNKSTCILMDSVADAILSVSNCSYTTIRNLTVTNKFAGTCWGISVSGNATDTKGSNSTIANCNVNVAGATASPSAGIIVSGAATSGSNNKLDSIVIDSNYVTGGYYGIMLYGNSGASSAQNRGHRVRNNTIVNAYTYGLYMYYIYNPTEVMFNDITMNPANTSTGYGLYHYYCQNSNTSISTKIIGNTLRNVQYMAMYIYYNASTATAPHKIYNNTVIGNMAYTTNYGCYLYTGVAGNYEFMHNTFHINGSGTTQYGLYYYNSTNVSGINCKNNIFSIYSTTGTTVYPAYFSSNPTGNLINYNIYYNSRSANLGYRGGAFTAANYKTATTGGDSSFNKMVNFVSNTDVHLADGCTRGVDLTALVPTDKDGITRSTSPSQGAYEYQNYSLDLTVDRIYTPVMPVTPGSQNVVVRVRNNGNSTVTSFNISYRHNGGTPVTIPWTGTLATCDTTLITFSGANQITIGTGTNAINVYTDAPNASADNYPVNDTLKVSYLYLPAMSGTYTIGGTGANFPGFAEAFTALEAAGVNGPVTFIVNPGTYSGNFTLNAPVYGVNATNTITIDGVNALTRIIQANASAPALKINQVSYVTVKNLSIINSYAGLCSGLALIGNTVDRSGTGFTVFKNNISLPNTGTNTSYGIIVTGTNTGMADGNQFTDSVTIDSNTVTGGYYGIQISTSGTGNASYNRGHRIRYNTLINTYYYGIRVYYIFNPVDIIGNNINMLGSNNSSYGIYLYYNQNAVSGNPSRIVGNNIYAGYAALYFYYFTSPLGTPVPINNNILLTYGTTYVAYLYTGATGGGEINVYHNTFRNNSTSTYGMYYYNTTTGTSNFKNNIFYATGNGTYPAYWSTNPTGNVINYNIYYNAGGGNLGYRGAAFNTTSYNTTTTGGDSSFNVLPIFTSSTNLRLENGCVRGVDLTSQVSTDIDNNVRSVPPVIGAHEASSTANDVGVETVYITTPVAAGYQDIGLRVRNNKGSSISGVNFGVIINGGTPQTMYWSGSINGCDTAMVTFSGANQINLPAGYNVVKVYSFDPAGLPDSKTSNDTVTIAMSTASIVPGNCFAGNGTGGRNIRFPHRPNMVTPNAITVEAWVNLSNPANNQKIVCKSSTTNGFVLGVQNGSIYPEFWTVANGTGSINLTAGAIPANTWTHLALTWQSGVGLKAYINGTLVGSVNSATVTTNSNSANDLTIGTNSWDQGHAAAGYIDEVRVWSLALDSVTLRKNMHRMLKGNEAGLVSYVQMNEPVSAPIVGDVISGATGNKYGTGIIGTSNLMAGGDTCLIVTGATSGAMSMYGMSVNLTSPFANACDIAALEIPLVPNALPSATRTLNDRYWMLNVFGNTGTTYAGDLTFTLPPFQISSGDTALKLYNRSPYSTGAWTLVQTALPANISGGAVTFYGVSTYGQFTLASNGTSPLPVKLVDFDASAVAQDVVLTWHTASEENNRGFAIERGIDNLEFEEIAFVNSHNPNSNKTQAYTYTDAGTDRSKTLYYRLRQVDMNGHYSYSPIDVVAPENLNGDISVYPNPFVQNVTLRGVAVGTEVVVTDLSGKVITRQTVHNGLSEEIVLPSDLKAGVYLIHAGKDANFKLIRQ